MGAMLHTKIRRLILATAVTSYLMVVLGATSRSFELSTVAPLLALGHRLVAVWVALLGAAVLMAGQRVLKGQRGVLIGAGLLIPLAVPALIGGPFSAYYETASALFATWMAAAIFSGGEEPHHSKLSMFRSQWQVPLYAAFALYVVTVLGTYLKTLGYDLACTDWPVCRELFTGGLGGLVMVHLAHRVAVLFAAGCLAYTVNFVWRQHQRRPVLLLITGSAAILFVIQVLLGADAARGTLSPLGQVAHLGIATALICTLAALSVVGWFAPSLPSMAGAEVAVTLHTRSLKEIASDYFATMKPRILVLLLITGYAAMGVAAKGFPSLPLTIVTLVGLGMSCGAANAINMWYDTDIDAIMKRTQKRPIPSGRLTPEQVLAFGILTGVLSFILLAFTVNLMTALLSLSGLLFYVGIYTMMLKRTTVQNIVIGGAAGAVPPLVGWAAVTGQVSWASMAMFLIIFMWTPPHFWALALFRNDDYRRANIPMMPVIKGEMYTKWHILAYTLLLFPTVISLYWTGVVGQWYLWISLAVTALYTVANVVLMFERLPEQTWAIRSFKWSLYWLTFVFLAMVLDIKH